MSMDIYAEPGTKVIFRYSDKEMVNWGSNHDPEVKLVIGEEYTVEKTEIHSWHTKVYLKEFPGLKFNSASFEDVL